MQRKFKFALCIFLAIFALLCTASAADIYVSADGDDTAAGTADAPVAMLHGDADAADRVTFKRLLAAASISSAMA